MATTKWRASAEAVKSVTARIADIERKLEGTVVFGNKIPASVPPLLQELKQLKASLPGLTQTLEKDRAAASNLVRSARQQAGAAITEKKLANLAAAPKGPVPFPEAAQVDSLDALEKLPAEVQKRLVGAVVVKDTLGDAGAARLSQSVANPVAGAAALATELGAAPGPSARAELLAQSGPALGQLVRGLLVAPRADASQAMVHIGLATDAAGPAAAKAVAAKLVAHIPNDGAQGLAQSLGDAVLDGAGATLGAEVAAQLRAAGKPDAAAAVEAQLAKSLKTFHAQFTSAQKKVAKVNAELGRLVQGFGPALSEEQLTAAVNAFKLQHETAYGKLEQASRNLSKVMEGAGVAFADDRLARGTLPRPHSNPGVLGTEAAKVLSTLPSLADTDAGRALVAKALVEDGKGGSSFLHTVEQHATLIGKGNKVLGGVTTVVAQVVAQQAMSALASGDMDHAAEIFKGMSAHASAYGLKPAQMDKVMGQMQAVLSGKEGAVDALGKEVTSLSAGAPSQIAMTSLKGLGLALAAYKAYTGFENWGAKGVADKIKTGAAALKVTSDGALFAFELLAKSKATQQLLKNVGAGLNTVVDGISLVQNFSKGEVLKGTADFASMAGGILMVVPGFQVAGTLVSLGAMGLKYFANERALDRAEGDAEKDARAFLQGAGIPEKQATKLADLTRSGHRNVGGFIVELAKYLGMPPTAVFRHLAAKSPEQLGALAARVKNILPNKAGGYAKSSDEDGLRAGMKPMALLGNLRSGPQTLESMRQWMVAEDLLPK